MEDFYRTSIPDEDIPPEPKPKGRGTPPEEQTQEVAIAPQAPPKIKWRLAAAILIATVGATAAAVLLIAI